MIKDLDAFVDEMLALARTRKYVPVEFMRMRKQHGTVSAISRLVTTPDIQQGFRRLCEIGLRDWTIEAAVLRFGGLFTRNDVACARYRLNSPF